MKSLPGKLTQTNAQIDGTTAFLVTQGPLDLKLELLRCSGDDNHTGLYVEMLFDVTPFKTDNSSLSVLLDEVVK